MSFPFPRPAKMEVPKAITASRCRSELDLTRHPELKTLILPIPRVGTLFDPADLQEADAVLALDVRAVPGIRRPGKYDICEAFSPPRVTTHAAEVGLHPGWSLDIHGPVSVTSDAMEEFESRMDALSVKKGTPGWKPYFPGFRALAEG